MHAGYPASQAVSLGRPEFHILSLLRNTPRQVFCSNHNFKIIIIIINYW